MRTNIFPLDDNVSSGVFALMADALSRRAFAPVRPASLGVAIGAPARERVGFWERLDRWAWRALQKDREAYLAGSQDIFELEERMRRIDRDVGSRFF